jgi:hypothetical protein
LGVWRSPRCPLTHRQKTFPERDVFISDVATLPFGLFARFGEQTFFATLGEL